MTQNTLKCLTKLKITKLVTTLQIRLNFYVNHKKSFSQTALPNYIQSILPNCFVLFKPKDIVSGDFYWFSETNEKIVFTAVDCTGHGVPGAFMSLIGANALNHIVNGENIDTPSTILNELNRLSSEALNKSEDIYHRNLTTQVFWNMKIIFFVWITNCFNNI